MITTENLTEILNNLTKEEITAVMESQADYLSLELFTFNAGFCATLNPIKDTTSEEAEEIQANGNVICDKDDFLRLVKESETTNKHLLELI